MGTERPRERVQLRKYLMTEPVTKSNPVTRDEVRVDPEPVGQDESAEMSEPEEAPERAEEVALRQQEPLQSRTSCTRSAIGRTTTRLPAKERCTESCERSI